MTEKQIWGKIGSLVAIAAFGVALSACRPMYGGTSMGGDVSYEMASVEVQTIPGRVGQRVRNELIFLFTGGGNPAQPNYKLEIILRESVQSVLFKRTDDSSGQIYSIDATYILRDIGGKSELAKGGSHAGAAFDKHDSTFANIRAQRDAQDRAARDIARDINNRVAAYISTHR
jgi:LPS-assembly lipoprotein